MHVEVGCVGVAISSELGTDVKSRECMVVNGAAKRQEINK